MKTKRLTNLIPVLLFAGSAAAQCDSQVLTPSDPISHQHFGHAVAVTEDTVMIGVWVDEEYSLDAGRVYVHERTPAGWLETQVLFPHDSHGFGGDLFGWDVSVYRGTALITRAGHNGFIFERGPGGWVETAELAAGPPTASGWFGCSASLFGNTAVLGDWLFNSQSGSARVFEKSGASWTQSQVLTPSLCAAQCWFGEDVAIHGDTIVVGAGGINSPDPGSAYFFERNPTGWIETQKVTASDGVPGDWFGGSVALYQDVAVVGAEQAAGGGAAYVFRRAPAGWVQEAKLAPGPGPDFGRGVAINWSPDSDFRILVSGDSGAYLYRRGANTWERIAVFQGTGVLDGPAALFGDTSAIGSPNGGFPDESGQAYLFTFPTFADPYCFCHSGPCANEDPFAGCRNSTGSGALLEACGTASVADDDLTLTLTGLPTSQFGILYMGGGQTQNLFGDGLRCVSPGGAGVFRYPVQNSGASGSIVLGPGIVALSQALFGPAGHLTAGQIWNFQGWFRDPGGPCGNDFNLSNGLRVSFVP